MRTAGLILVVVLAFLTLLFHVAGVHISYDPNWLLVILQSGFQVFIPAVVAYMSGSEYAKSGQLQLLVLGAAMFAFAAFNAILVAGIVMVTGSDAANMMLTTHNSGLLALAGITFIGAVLALLSRIPPRLAGQRVRRRIITAYAVTGSGVVVYSLLGIAGSLPAFWSGGAFTDVRDGVLTLAVLLFVMSSLILARLYLESRSGIVYWYALGLSSMAIGAAGVLLEPSMGTPLSWTGRAAQYVASLFFLLAVHRVSGGEQWTSAFNRSRAQFDQLSANMTAGFAYHQVAVDEKGEPVDFTFVEINPAWTRHTGLGREIVGRSATEVLPRVKMDPKEWIGRFGKVAVDGNPIYLEARFEPLEKWFAVTAYSPERGYFVVLLEDVTERKRRAQLEKVLNQVNSLINSTLDYDEMMKRAAAAGTQGVGAESAVINMREGDHWTARFVHNAPANVVGQQQSDEDSPTSMLALRSRTANAIDDPKNDSRVNKERMKELGVTSLLVAPIIVRTEVTGVIIFYNHSTPKVFSPSEIEFSNKFASALSIAMQNARQHEELRNSEERFRSIVNGAPYGMHFYELKPNGNLVFTGANPIADIILGIDHNALVGLTIQEAFPMHRTTDIPAIYSEVAATGRPWHSEQVQYEDERIKGAFEVHAFQISPGRMAAGFVDITERLRVAQALAESEERLRFHVENTPLAVVEWDANFVVTRWAGGAESMFGWKTEETVGVPITQLNLIYPDDVPLVERTMTRLTDGSSRQVIGTNRNVAKDGRVLHCTWYNTTQRDRSGKMKSVLSFVLDNTARQQAENALKESEERFYKAFDANPAAMTIADLESGKWVDVNQGFVDLSGYSKEELLGKRSPELGLFEDSSDRVEMMRELTEKGAVTNRDLVAHTRAGNRRLLFSAVKISLNGKPHAVTMHVDITDRKAAEEELRRSNAELQQFAYVASHDLQEPLRMIISYLSLLEKRYRDQLDQRGKEYIDIAVNGGERMRALIDDLLEYSRIETRAQPFERVDMNELVARTLRGLEKPIRENNAIVEVGPLPTIMADQTQMVQLLQNLVSNAVKFHGPLPPRIRVSCTDDGGEYTFSVNDNGIGIDPKYSEVIFQMFQRLHTKEEYPGTGIGLAVAKKIVERHGGRIWVVSKEGEGATFLFTVPKNR